MFDLLLVSPAIAIAIAFLLTSFAHSHDEFWSTTVLPPINRASYHSLRACVLNKQPRHATSCFTNASAPTSQLKSLLTSGMPPLLLVPDCLESILESQQDSAPLFTATAPIATTTTTTVNIESASLLRSKIHHSVRNLEVAHPPRRVPGGGYTVLVNALHKIGYVDGETMRAAAWDWRLPVDNAVERVSALLDHSEMIVVARGAGCALAAKAATSKRIRALLCLSEPTDGIVPAGLYANELGLVVRRRGRPVPIVSGPWGDGTGPRRCEAHRNIEAVDGASLTVLCADDCRRWVKGARIEECDRESVLTNELDCLVNVLIESH